MKDIAAIILLLSISFGISAEQPYRILITNDDGINAKGLHALVDELSKTAEVVVSAPKDKAGGSSHASNLWNGPMAIESVTVEGSEVSYAVQGTPADAARFGIIEIQKSGKPIDLVISGINSGDNAGSGAHLSGTIGAAMEALYYNIPAIAVSLDHAASDLDAYGDAALFIGKLVATIRRETLPGNVMLNVNVPATIKGVKVAPMGDYSVEVRSYTKTKAGYVADIAYPDSTAPGTDYYEYQQGYITVSPLKLDMTDYQAIETLQSWTLD